MRIGSLAYTVMSGKSTDFWKGNVGGKFKVKIEVAEDTDKLVQPIQGYLNDTHSVTYVHPVYLGKFASI